MSECVIVMTTTDSREEASRLAREAVEGGWAACVQAVPVASTFRWEGEVQEVQEHLLLFKTAADRAEALRERLAASHGYDTPEILEVPVAAGSRAYLDWVVASTRGVGDGGRSGAGMRAGSEA